jgi:ketosteroid isomerase-like protein
MEEPRSSRSAVAATPSETAELDGLIAQDRLALEAFMRGDPEPKKRLYSRGDDATLSNPFGPPARGWEGIERTLDKASAALREGESVAFERVSAFATAELAYTVEIERYNGVKIGGADERVDHALRVTTIFRLEPDGWRIVHRHADPITTPRGPESLVER